MIRIKFMRSLIFTLTSVAIVIMASYSVYAASAAEINARVDTTLSKFYKEVPEAKLQYQLVFSWVHNLKLLF